MTPARISGFAAAMMLITALPLQAQDGDGCYNARGCITATTKWSGSTLVTTVRNSCNKGVYLRLCTRRSSGSPDCGASHVNANGKYTFTGYNAHSSGDVRYTWVGSVKSGKDWVCAGKVDGFNDPMF